MKTLFLHNYFHVKSGSNVIMFEEAELLKKKGHEVFYFCTDKKPYYDENYKYLDFFPKYIDFSKLSLKDKILNFYRPFYNPEAVKKFGLLLDTVKPDVVHDHTISYYLTPFILFECYKRKIPVITTVHSGKAVLIPDKTKKQNIFDNFISNFSPFGIFKSVIYKFYDMIGVFSKIAYFVFPSKALSEFYKPGKISKEKIIVINNFLKSKVHIEPNSEKGEYFLYIGRLVPEKGIYDLINVWKKLPEEIKLHIVGTGKEERKLKQIINEKNLNNIKLLGFLKGRELEEQYKNCIANILPSIWFENFPTTVLESFMHAKPSIANRVGGIPEMIDDNVNGILVEPYNIEELKNAVERLYYDEELSIKMGLKGKEKLEASFTPEMHYEKLISLYQNAIEGIK